MAPVVVWPEHVRSVSVFAALQTQWYCDPAGRLRGLRYETLPAVWQALAVSRRRRPRVFHDLRVMEIAVLAALHEEISDR